MAARFITASAANRLFTHIPGLRVVMPSNALDACGLLRTAIRCDDPVLFLEHKKLYREPYNRSPHPGPDYTIPFGKAKVVKSGQSLTVVTYGALVQKSLQAVLQVEQRFPDRSIEVIDLRSLSPYDWDAIKLSVEKTGRILVAHEDTLSWGYGAELAARVASELFENLDAPVGRLGALDTWVGYNPVLENETLPQVENLVTEMERLLRGFFLRLAVFSPPPCGGGLCCAAYASPCHRPCDCHGTAFAPPKRVG